MLFFNVALGLIALTLAVVQLLIALDRVHVPDSAASPFVRNSNPRGVKVAMSVVMAIVGVGLILIGLIS